MWAPPLLGAETVSPSPRRGSSRGRFAEIFWGRGGTGRVRRIEWRGAGARACGGWGLEPSLEDFKILAVFDRIFLSRCGPGVTTLGPH